MCGPEWQHFNLSGAKHGGRMQRWMAIWIQTGFLIITLGACGAQPAQEQTLRKDVVKRGDIDEVVSATGAVLAEERVDLSFRQVGSVTEVFVEVGSVVKAGDRLASMNADSLDLAVRQAELGLEAQKLAFAKLTAPPGAATVAGANASVVSAIAGYDKLNAPPDKETIQIAQFQYEQAYAAYIKADSELRAVQWYAPPSVVDQYRAALGVAINNLESARLRLEQLGAPPDKNALAAASASIAQAQAQLNGVKAGPSELELARAQTQIAQAELALNRAIQNRDQATLVAPFSGVITTVNITPGALISTGLPAIVMIDNSRLHVEVNVDEIDIGKVSTGQPVDIDFDALPSQSVAGQVTRVATTATNNAGVVTYLVRIDLAQNSLPIRSGMTATANIVVQRLVNALIAPNWAIRFDRSTGQAYLSIEGQGGRPTDVPVLLGLRSPATSQIIAGVEEGQAIAVSITPDQLELFGNNQNSSQTSGGDSGK
jgi:HlyD family secretion protein